MSNLIKRRRVLETFTGKATGLPGSIPQSTLLKEWWRADSGLWQDSGLTTPAVGDGDPVGGFVGRFAGVAATQATAGRRGTLRLAAIGGKNAVQFVSASTQFLSANSIAGSFSGAAHPVTLISVFRLTAITATNTIMGLNGSPGGLNEIREKVAGWSYQQEDANSVFSEIRGGAPDTKPHILIGIFDGQIMSLRLDGVQIGQKISSSTGGNTATLFSLGSRGGGSLPMDGLIAEAVAYSGALTLSSLEAWEIYLARRYGLL